MDRYGKVEEWKVCQWLETPLSVAARHNAAKTVFVLMQNHGATYSKIMKHEDKFSHLSDPIDVI